MARASPPVVRDAEESRIRRVVDARRADPGGDLPHPDRAPVVHAERQAARRAVGRRDGRARAAAARPPAATVRRDRDRHPSGARGSGNGRARVQRGRRHARRARRTHGPRTDPARDAPAHQRQRPPRGCRPQRPGEHRRSLWLPPVLRRVLRRLRARRFMTVAARRAAFLPFSPPAIGEEEIAEVVDTLRSHWITTGPKTKRFEAEFAASVGATGALALNSCTAGLHTALATFGIGAGDEVITTPLTFAASVNVIEHVRARPVLVDVEADTLNIDPAAVAAAVTPRTKAILPVHYAGHPVDLDAIWEIAARHGLAVIEDAAHALPARYKGKLIGSGPNPAAFSFYATKNLTTAEGGMLTGAPEFLERARVRSLHGMSGDAWRRYGKGGKWFYEIVCPGFKYNMTDIQAALGLCQLKKLERFQERRREVVAAYN